MFAPTTLNIRWPMGGFLTREDAADARRISVFAKVTQSGDKAECL
jgi:ATP-dependent DNA helicase DinG